MFTVYPLHIYVNLWVDVLNCTWTVHVCLRWNRESTSSSAVVWLPCVVRHGLRAVSCWICLEINIVQPGHSILPVLRCVCPAIWSVISISELTAGTAFKLLSDALVFTEEIHSFDLSYSVSTRTTVVALMRFAHWALYPAAMFVIKAHSAYGLRPVIFFFAKATVPILGHVPGSIQHGRFHWGTKRKWQGNRHSVRIVMAAQARLFIPRLMGWRLELKLPDWEKHVPVLLKPRDNAKWCHTLRNEPKSLQKQNETLWVPHIYTASTDHQLNERCDTMFKKLGSNMVDLRLIHAFSQYIMTIMTLIMRCNMLLYWVCYTSAMPLNASGPYYDDPIFSQLEGNGTPEWRLIEVIIQRFKNSSH